MASILRSGGDELATSLHRAGFLHLYAKLSPTCRDIPSKVLIEILHHITNSSLGSCEHDSAHRFLDPNDTSVKLKVRRIPPLLEDLKLNLLSKFKPKLKVDMEDLEESRSSIHFSLEEAASRIDRNQKFDEILTRGVSDHSGNHLAYTVKIHLTPSLLSN
ncbi:hypothetical protein DSO57_1021866 [Entomophthora muscae]|uniref:Uncharacterized protein n=1 Tax=Entomophthora muscae TaxID=34485 RepID=A0ACC2RUC3_9FUNG|nr:hypothetical protein DSO57_1021866 [Entomophthora muscae]